MRDEWYGDKRDLIKWGALLELASRYKARHILQVLYYRKSRYGSLEIAGEQCDLHPAVIRHFRRPAAVTAISCNAKIHVVEEPFKAREAYLDLILRGLHSLRGSPKIVFLDPDTGLAPRHPSTKHVLDEEVNRIWKELRGGDILALYQHRTNRNGKPWMEAKKVQFESAIRLPRGAASVASATGIADDVVIFFAEKKSN